MSMRCHYVASTPVRGYYDVFCLLGVLSCSHSLGPNYFMAPKRFKNKPFSFTTLVKAKVHVKFDHISTVLNGLRENSFAGVFRRHHDNFSLLYS